MTDYWNELTRRRFLAMAAAGGVAAGRNLKGQSVPTLSLLPLLARPTNDSILVSARNGPLDGEAQFQIRTQGSDEWMDAVAGISVRAGEFLTHSLSNLETGTSYQYRLLMAIPGGEPAAVAQGQFRTQPRGEVSFRAALMTDSHTGTFVDGSYPLEILDEVVRNVRRDRPEFVIAMGDNVAWGGSRGRKQEDDVGARRAYTMYRRHMEPLSMSCPHFGLIGNWEGESGKLPDESVARMISVRKQFTPNPTPETYAWGGGSQDDYYAFDWGSALFVILNVQSYTEPSAEPPSIRDDVAVVEDWTLGKEQFFWLEKTLDSSDHPYKFICIHHAVGGAGGTHSETLYGRGGAQAAAVGEQKRVHELMVDQGVQAFFYGHDHVFVDDVIDGIHYSLPGSCGAPWKFGRDITGYRRFWADSGHARLDVRPDAARVEYVNLAGQVIHEFTLVPRAGA